MASFAATCARITSSSPAGVLEETKVCGFGVPNTCAFSMAANFMFSIIFSKFMPTWTLPSSLFPEDFAADAAAAACRAIIS